MGSSYRDLPRNRCCLPSEERRVEVSVLLYVFVFISYGGLRLVPGFRILKGFHKGSITGFYIASIIRIGFWALSVSSSSFQICRVFPSPTHAKLFFSHFESSLRVALTSRMHVLNG